MRQSSVLIVNFLILTTILFVGPHRTIASPALDSSVNASSLSEKKQTSLGLYVTAGETNALLQSRKDIALIDVRTPEETMFVGFPEAASVNIPYKRVDPGYGFNAKKRSYRLVVNPDFAASVRTFLKTPAGRSVTTLILMCRSGSRSADAVDALASAGFTNVYSMVDGFEGDTDTDGRRTVNGWKNVDATWTTKLRDNYWLRSP